MAEEQQNAAATPAEGASAEGGEAAAEPKKGLLGNKMVLIGAGVFILLAIVGVILFFVLGGKGHEEEVVIDPAAAVVMYDVPPMSVNLLVDSGSPSRFLKAKMALELGSETDKQAVEKMLPRLQDDWQNFLRQMRVEDTEGSAAMQRLKEALLLRANQVLAPVVVRNVLFRELLVQ